MHKLAAPIAALLLLCSLPSHAQKKVPPAKRKAPAPSIRFQGAPEYTQEELLAAAGLKPNARLSASEVKARAKQLNDTGFFAEVRFSNDSKGPLFTLTPSTQLFPIHLDNLPLKPGKELDDKLHERFPLYHGLLPANGSVLEGIRQTFEEMLAAQGVKATVKAALTSGLGPKKITAINFTVTSPAVRIGAIQLSGVSAAMQARADGLVAGQTGNEFDTENSAIGLQHAFEDLYQDQGYAAVEVEVAEIEPLMVTDQAVEIPYKIAIREGGVYKLGAIRLSGLTRWFPARRFRRSCPNIRLAPEGRSTCFSSPSATPIMPGAISIAPVTPHPPSTRPRTSSNYSVDVAPGPLYRMAAVEFDGAPNAMAVRLTRLWKMAPGDAFDESYVSGFAAFAQKKDRSLSKWMQTVITTFDVKADPATHQVNVVFHFAKAAQGGR